MREVAGDVVADGVRERRRVGLERLHDHPPGRVAPAPTGELRHELERPLLGSEVREREPGVRVHDGGDLDAGEVMPLRDHLRADERSGAGAREALERLAKRSRARSGIGVEPNPLEPGKPPFELRIEPLRSRTDARELHGAALGARLRQSRPSSRSGDSEAASRNAG